MISRKKEYFISVIKKYSFVEREQDRIDGEITLDKCQIMRFEAVAWCYLIVNRFA